jgi:hypothetical protein
MYLTSGLTESTLVLQDTLDITLNKQIRMLAIVIYIDFLYSYLQGLNNTTTSALLYPTFLAIQRSVAYRHGRMIVTGVRCDI